MDSRGAIRASWQSADMISNMYLGDLTDAELLVRPVPGINHIAWQLGHLIQSTYGIMEGVCPGSMPTLPAGFKEKHSKETATSDKPADFLTKAEYLKLAAEQNAAAAVALAKQTDADLDKPSPDSMKDYAPTVGEAFLLLGSHWLMHAGQWAVTRRKLGRPPLF
ncbi:MAG: DinB superfamily protein [Planctomycetaceae bacterium]|nr:DinB superfamily protein [Planctomycetaceae bacterium]